MHFYCSIVAKELSGSTHLVTRSMTAACRLCGFGTIPLFLISLVNSLNISFKRCNISRKMNKSSSRETSAVNKMNRRYYHAMTKYEQKEIHCDAFILLYCRACRKVFYYHNYLPPLLLLSLLSSLLLLTPLSQHHH